MFAIIVCCFNTQFEVHLFIYIQSILYRCLHIHLKVKLMAWGVSQKEIFHLLVQSPCGLNDQESASWKLGTRRLSKLFHGADHAPSTWGIFCCFPRLISRKLGQSRAVQAQSSGLLSDVRILHGCLTPCPTSRPQFLCTVKERRKEAFAWCWFLCRMWPWAQHKVADDQGMFYFTKSARKPTGMALSGGQGHCLPCHCGQPPFAHFFPRKCL